MKFKIWMEGYECTGNRSTASFKGEYEAETFKDACDLAFKDDKYYDGKKLSYWGCRLYDNEIDARKTFG